MARSAKNLTAYRAKRDFSRTSEPQGTDQGETEQVGRQGAERALNPSAAAPYPRFVIQKHDARRLHYDLRLELDGVFKSWAVTRGPSLDPATKRLAVEVEDHPLDYGDFEGTIPKGEYGGGTVMVWDRGYWSPSGDKTAAEALRDGELKFTTGGEKFRGSWVLVRLAADREKPASGGPKSSETGRAKTNWLLIKHRDEWARPASERPVTKVSGTKVAGAKASPNEHRADGQQDDGQPAWDAADDGDARSVASGRTMAQIAAGAAPGPTPFIVARPGKAAPDAIWQPDPLPAQPAESGKPGSAKRPRIIPVKAQGYRVAGVVISKPSKELWPAVEPVRAVTKLDLAEYLATVGPWLIEHIRGRPCSVVRAPDGIDGETFFQRHEMPGARRVRLVMADTDGKPYLQIDTVAGLVTMGQLAAVEFHPWNGAPEAPAVPGRLVFDLDPAPDVPFAAVVAGALELRERLARIGLIGFCKTTGGKGLHVVTPLDSATEPLDWPAARTFAHTLCAQMAEDSPARYLTSIAIKQRTGRILLDYLRNDRSATAVAVLSPRARPGATVSMPLTWKEVVPTLDPKRYTIATVPGLLPKSAAWRDYGRSGRSLRAAIHKLIG